MSIQMMSIIMFCFLYDCIEQAIHSLLQAGDSSAGLRRRILEAKDAEEQLHVDQYAILAAEWEPRRSQFPFSLEQEKFTLNVG
jgi:hypothetical protein